MFIAPRKPRFKNAGVIPRRWFRLLPGQGLAFWLRVEMIRKRKGIRKRDDEGVRGIALALFEKERK